MRIAVIIALVASSCLHPRPPDNCEPEATRCVEGVAQICDAELRWGDFLDCNDVDSATANVWVCCEIPAGATCIPQTECGGD